ncbi:MAG TPA: hypothetical protein VM307_02195 [Egibacteraceae bacterium]|nr:hypothetical protein [Egibacteraceae bacterium]
MRQERIRKTPRRRSRHTESSPLTFAPNPADTSDAECVLQRIDQLLEAA